MMKKSKATKIIDGLNNSIKDDEQNILQKGIEKLTEGSSVFHFLHNEENIYTIDDIKENLL
jgi:hypothetical protein